jgi:hypothetical protein
MGDIVNSDIADFATAAQGTTADASAATIATYGNIVTTDIADYATAAQGSTADTAVQPGDFGTGVSTALAVNVGSAGAFVVFGGALGTPASGNLANCTIPTSGISDLGAGVGTFLTTPTAANLATAVTDLGDIITTDAADYATAAQGGVADTALQPYGVVTNANQAITLSAASHANKQLNCTASGGAITVTIDGTNGCTAGDDGIIVQAHATNAVTVTASGTTFQPTGNKVTTSQWDFIYWKCVDTDTFLLVGGQITAASVANVAKVVEMSFRIHSDAAITTGVKHALIVPVTGNIIEVRVARESATSGTTTIDFLYEDDGTFPVAGDTITAGNVLSITTTGIIVSDTNLSDWTSVAVVRGALLGIEVEANNDSTFITVLVLIQPTE